MRKNILNFEKHCEKPNLNIRKPDFFSSKIVWKKIFTICWWSETGSDEFLEKKTRTNSFSKSQKFVILIVQKKIISPKNSCTKNTNNKKIVYFAQIVFSQIQKKNYSLCTYDDMFRFVRSELSVLRTFLQKSSEKKERWYSMCVLKLEICFCFWNWFGVAVVVDSSNFKWLLIEWRRVSVH